MTGPVWMAFPPEVFSSLLSSGPGSGPMLAAAAAWEELSTTYAHIAQELSTLLTTLQESSWQGPSAETYVAAHLPYLTWLIDASADSHAASVSHTSAAVAYDTALAAMPTMAELTANHLTHAALLATNFLGINTIPLALNEADYAAMWVRAATTMSGYEAASTHAITASSAAQTPPAPQVLQHVHHHVEIVGPPSGPTGDKGTPFSSQWWTSRWQQILQALHSDTAGANPFQTLITDGFFNSVLPHYAGEATIGLSPAIPTLTNSPLGAFIAPVGLSGVSGLAGLAGINNVTTPTPVMAGIVPQGSVPNVGIQANPAIAQSSPPATAPHSSTLLPSSQSISMASPASPPSPPALGVGGSDFFYLVSAMQSQQRALQSRRSARPSSQSHHVRSTEETQRRPSMSSVRRSKRRLTDPGNRYEYLDTDPISASEHGEEIMGFSGVHRHDDASPALGLTNIADEHSGLPMMPHTWTHKDPDS